MPNDAGGPEGDAWTPPDSGARRGAGELELVDDINSTPRGIGAYGFLEHEGEIVFGAHGPNGNAIFAVRGNETPRELARADSWTGVPTLVASWEGMLLFTVGDAFIGNELWSYREGELTPYDDIEPGSRSGWGAAVGPLSSGFVFIANTAAGRQAMRLDRAGNAASFMPVGVAPSLLNHHPFAIVGERLFFASVGGADGEELWVSDGTATGTRLLRDICSGPCGSRLTAFRPFGDRLFFVADDGEHGVEPWISDGTEAGTRMIRDLAPGPAASANILATPAVEHAGKVYFPATDGVHGRELWATDGTAEGTHMVADLNPGAPDGAPGQFLSSGDRLFFAAQSGGDTRELHVLHGRSIASLGAQTVESPVAARGIVFFPGRDPEHGVELWRTEGSPSNTRRVVDLSPGAADGITWSLTGIGEYVYFGGNDGQNPSSTPYRSDGTAEGTRPLGDLAGDSTAPAFNSSVLGFAVVGDRAFFMANDGEHGRELWSWVPGSAPRLVRDVRPGAADGVSTGGPVAADGRVFFVADDGVHGAELWVSDGTEAGTQMVVDLNPGSAGSGASGLVWTGERLLFVATDGSEIGREPYVAEGHPPTVRLLADLNPEPYNTGGGSNHFVVDGDVYANLTNEEGAGLFRIPSDGAPVRLTPRNLFCSALAFLGGAVYGSCNHGIGYPPGGPPGLYRTDGTREGTAYIANVFPSQFFELDGELAFVRNGSIYTFDGETGASIQPVVSLGILGPVSVYNRAAYFFGGDGDHGLGLFRTDFRTRRLELIHSFGSSSPHVAGNVTLTVSGDRLYFAASDGLTGVELWWSDGSPEGTELYYDIFPGPRSSNPRWAGEVAGRKVWVADDGVHGLELWASAPP